MPCRKRFWVIAMHARGAIAETMKSPQISGHLPGAARTIVSSSHTGPQPAKSAFWRRGVDRGVGNRDRQGTQDQPEPLQMQFHKHPRTAGTQVWFRNDVKRHQDV